MANIESKNLLVAVKAYSRGNALPLDASEVYDSLAAAQTYATEANAYAGQTIKVLEDGKYKSYVLQPSESGLTLEEVGAVQPKDLKKYVQVVESLPATGEENIIYIVGTTGSKWNGTTNSYDVIFKDLTTDLDDINDNLDTKAPIANPTFTGTVKVKVDEESDAEELALKSVVDTKAPIADPTFTGTVKIGTDEVATKPYVDGLIENLDETKAPIASPTFTGTVKVGDDEVAVKSYVDGLIAGLHSGVPEILNSTSPLPTEEYKAGQTWRVSEAGTYAGQKCEVGDLIICLKSFDEENASNDDFMVVQANIDGAVTSNVETVTDATVVVFDGVTGKVIKSSNISLTDLSDAVTKKHEHANATQLNSFTKTETELLADAESTANDLVEAAKTELQGKIDEKVDADYVAGELEPITEDLGKKANSADVYTKTEIDGTVETINENINKKANTDDVYTKTEIDGKVTTIESNLNTKVAIADFNTKIGDLGENASVKEFVENTVSAANEDANEYVDSKLGDIKDAEGNTQTVKEYVDNGLAIKADKATTIAGYGITDAYTKTEVDTKISSDITTAKTELTTEINKKAAQSDVDELSGKVTTLIGEDTAKSVRTIANEEIAAKLIPATAKESLDTLEEIAAWIQEHPDDAAAMNADITALKNQLIGIEAGEGTVKSYIDNKVANIDLTPYATKDELTAGVTEAKAYTDSALTIVRF